VLSEKSRKRLAEEYRYAANKMQNETQIPKKLFYFTVLFSEAQRMLNLEWDSDLVLLFVVTQNLHTQVNATMQMPMVGGVIPIDWAGFLAKLTQLVSDLASYFEKAGGDSSKEELHNIFGRLAEATYAVSGNGSYLLEKGSFKL
jgi:predicted sugar kinase